MTTVPIRAIGCADFARNRCDMYYVLRDGESYYAGMSSAPSGRRNALCFTSAHDAQNELDLIRSCGCWPLCSWRVEMLRELR